MSKTEEVKPIRRSAIMDVIRNIDQIAAALQEGRPADKELMVKMINRMLAFLDQVIKPGSMGKDDVREV